MGEQVASWEQELDPRENHFDRRITVKTPLRRAGAYLLVDDLNKQVRYEGCTHIFASRQAGVSGADDEVERLARQGIRAVLSNNLGPVLLHVRKAGLRQSHE